MPLKKYGLSRDSCIFTKITVASRKVSVNKERFVISSYYWKRNLMNNTFSFFFWINPIFEEFVVNVFNHNYSFENSYSYYLC